MCAYVRILDFTLSTYEFEILKIHKYEELRILLQIFTRDIPFFLFTGIRKQIQQA